MIRRTPRGRSCRTGCSAAPRRRAAGWAYEGQVRRMVETHDESLRVAHERKPVHPAVVDLCLLLIEAVYEIDRGHVRRDVWFDSERGIGERRRQAGARSDG